MSSASSLVFRISQLTLTNFRNHASLRLKSDAKFVCIAGPNGIGKTNVLEALSLFAPGRGFRNAALHEFRLQSAGEDAPWGAAINLQRGADEWHLATGWDGQSTQRQVRLQHNPLTQDGLGDYLRLVWLVPQMDGLLGEGATARRKFLDRLAASYDPAHLGRLNSYQQALRERLKLLREGRYDQLWLKSIEVEAAAKAVAIAASRSALLSALQTVLAQTDSAFPNVDLALDGAIEAAVNERPALAVEEEFAAQLFTARAEDATSGQSNYGIQKTDFRVTYRAKAMPAEYCSTGEQKALLIRLILAQAQLIAQDRGQPPILLLDDLVSHLDADRRAALFSELSLQNSQVWLTGVNVAEFDALPDKKIIQF